MIGCCKRKRPVFTERFVPRLVWARRVYSICLHDSTNILWRQGQLWRNLQLIGVTGRIMGSSCSTKGGSSDKAYLTYRFTKAINSRSLILPMDGRAAEKLFRVSRFLGKGGPQPRTLTSHFAQALAAVGLGFPLGYTGPVRRCNEFQLNPPITRVTDYDKRQCTMHHRSGNR